MSVRYPDRELMNTRRRNEWLLKARAAACAIPAIAADVAALDARIQEQKAKQAALLDLSGYERRTFSREEKQNFDMFQEHIDDAERKLRSIFLRALPDANQ